MARPEASGEPTVALGAPTPPVPSRGSERTRMAHRDLPVHLCGAHNREAGLAPLGRSGILGSGRADSRGESGSLGIPRGLASATNVGRGLTLDQRHDRTFTYSGCRAPGVAGSCLALLVRVNAASHPRPDDFQNHAGNGEQNHGRHYGVHDFTPHERSVAGARHGVCWIARLAA